MAPEPLRLSFAMRETGQGPLAVYCSLGLDQSTRPVAVILHGALRSSEILIGEWARRLQGQFDLIFLDLPGHGRSALYSSLSAAAMADGVAEAVSDMLVGRAAVLIGESAGGIVALALAGRGGLPWRLVVAADPPLSTARAWPVFMALAQQRIADPASSLVPRLSEDFFGYHADGTVSERNYLRLLDGIATDVVLVTGDVPLWPPRNAAAPPCLMDEMDEYLIEKLYGGTVTVKRLANCGHVVMADGAAAVHGLIRDEAVRLGMVSP